MIQNYGRVDELTLLRISSGPAAPSQHRYLCRLCRRSRHMRFLKAPLTGEIPVEPLPFRPWMVTGQLRPGNLEIFFIFPIWLFCRFFASSS